MNDDMKLCRVCGSRLASRWRGGELVYYCAHCAEAAEAEVTRLRSALEQARADRALMAGLWLGTVPPDVLPGLLPASPDDRDRLAAVLAAVDLHPSAASHTAAGRAVVERIVADTKGGE